MSRAAEIYDHYNNLIDKHLNDLVKGHADKMLEIEDFAGLLFIHPIHLSNTIKEFAGTSACGIYQVKILEVAQSLLQDTKWPVKDVALQLDFEVSQFTKWFKKLTGITPGQYRQKLKS